MAEKKETKTAVKKTAKKPEKESIVAKAVADAVIESKEIKAPVQPLAYVAPQDPLEDIAEDDISKEIAKTLKESAGKPDRYFEAIGRRKTSVARIRLYTKGDKEFLVNDAPYQKYFQTIDDQETCVSSMKKMKCLDKFRITVIVKGGGHRAQAEAIRHGTARVLVDFNANFRKRLRKAGFLTRDPRMRERKKFGLRRARRAPQWAKR